MPNCEYVVISCFRSGNMNKCTVPAGTVYCCLKAVTETERQHTGWDPDTPDSGDPKTYADTRTDNTRSATR
jgi:hypothetical protein